MKCLDLSHPLHEGMPVYPGTTPPLFRPCTDIETDGYLETELRLLSHTGTHLDAPAHLLPQGETLDRMKIDRFIGPGCRLDMTHVCGRDISANDLEPLSELLSGIRFALIMTGWSRFWGRAEYLRNYPALAPDAARMLAATGISGLGLDTISPDPLNSNNLPAHRELLGQGCIIIENLTKLKELPDRDFTLSCPPLNIIGGDGSPVRAVALIP